MDWEEALGFDRGKKRLIKYSCKKKLFTKPPDESIIIADISFRVNIKNGVNYNSRGDILSVLQFNSDNNQEWELLIKTATTQEFHTSMLPISQNYRKKINNAMKPQCIWVLRSISNNVLTVDIVIKAGKLPLYNASYIAELFFDAEYSDDTLVHDKICYADEFFKELKDFQNDVLDFEKREIQDEKLLLTLRPYQYEAVQWMLSRECGEFQARNDWIKDVVHKSTSSCGTTLYYYLYSKVLSLNLFEFPKYFRGGILADEMGLGKTVVVIALILNNPRNIKSELDNDNFLKAEVENSDDEPSAKKIKLSEGCDIRCVCGDNSFESNLVQCPECLHFLHKDCVAYEKGFLFFCPPCWMKQTKLIKSRATLVVAPTSIFKQWFEEIEKHVDDEAWTKGVYMYNGVTKNTIQPSVLSSFDVVITTYTVLAAEFGYTSEKKFNFRHERKYIRECSPITQIQWWRVCLDEAQMVEFGHNSLIISKMAKLIPAVNHWSVTGTPIQNSVHDLFYLTDWFDLEPFNDKNFWESCLYKPFLNGNKKPFFSVLSQIFWRNSKDDVKEDLTIPKQKTIYHPVKFTAVEQSFYMMEHANVSEKFTEEINRLGLDLNQTLDSLSKWKLSKVLAPMLKLRQACSHHLAVCYEDISEMYKEKKDDNQRGKSFINRSMTLTALLEYLQRKTSNECEGALKTYLTSLNDLALFHCHSEDWPAAIECYQKMFRTSAEFKNEIKMDFYLAPKIQMLEEKFSDVLSKPLQEIEDDLKIVAHDLKKFIKIGSAVNVHGSADQKRAESKKSLSELKKKFGTLTYLKNLGKDGRDPCPVCFTELDSQWSLLQCGHSLCLQCTKILLEQNGHIICPVCREITYRPDVGVVDLNTDNENFDVEILGDHSSKIDAILTTLLDLIKKDPYVKVLIFSKWDIVLSVLGNAFKQNKIVFKRLSNSNIKALDDFKNPDKNVTALLLPYTWGCKGLNLIEATHVFLVEPTLNPAEELQAIGRIHRMGQTKETMVHRFLVKGTIEEAIHSAVSEAKDKWDREIATLADLKNLFVIK